MLHKIQEINVEFKQIEPKEYLQNSIVQLKFKQSNINQSFSNCGSQEALRVSMLKIKKRLLKLNIFQQINIK